MRFAKLLIPWACTLLIVSACNLPITQPQEVSTATPTARPTGFPFPTLTPEPTLPPPTATAIPVPGWVADFSDPILKSLSDRRPTMEDEFSPYNQGWFIRNPEDIYRPYYAHVKDGALFLQLPEATGRKVLTVYNPRLRYRDFVLSFDFKFGKTEPDDILRFQFGQSADETVSLDLSKNETWTYRWTVFAGLNSEEGTYDYFSPEYLNVTIIIRGDECAVYLNHDPVQYFESCRPHPAPMLPPQGINFHLIGTGRPLEVVIDNFRLWDLAGIAALP
ncbi:MAG: hypothetical protein AB1649_29650 [Chloroflexota bacterium]